MKQKIFILLFLAASVFVNGQDRRKIDSLFKITYTDIPDSFRSDLFNSIAHKFQQIDLDSVIKHGHNSLRIAEKIKDKRRIASACMAIGTGHMGVGEYDNAFGFYKRAMNTYFEMGSIIEAVGALNNIGLVFWNKADYQRALNCFFIVDNLAQRLGKRSYRANALGNIGLIYWSMSDFQNALDYQLKCLKLREELGNKETIAICLSNIGIDYESLREPKNALEYHFRCLKICEELGLRDMMGTTYGNIGVAYSDLGEEDKSLEYQEKSLKIHEELGAKDGIALALSNLGNNKNKKGDYESALRYYLKAKEINEEIGARQNVSNCLINLCQNYTRTKKYTEAEAAGYKGLEMAREIKDIGCESEAESVLYELFKQIKQSDKALMHHERYVKLRDSIYKDDNQKEIARKEFRYLLEKNEAAQKMETERAELSHQAESTQQRIIIGATALILLVLFIFSVSLYKRFNITRQQNIIIEEKQREIIDSINYAKRIQTALMTHHDLLKENIPDHFILFKPKAIVSGDFYWVNKKDNFFYIAVCDSTGHGVPGAFMSLLNISYLNEAINERNILEPDKILNYVRERLVESISKDEHQDGFDGAVLCIDKNNGKITYSAANSHPILIQNSEVHELPHDKMPVGKGEKMSTFTLQTIEANPGDQIYLYSDGYGDQFGGPQGKKFKYRNLNQLLLVNNKKSMAQQLQILDETFENWRGGLEQIDDVCVVGLRI